MVRYRAIVGMIAMLGVLLHAGLMVRHNAMMLNAKFLNQELTAALGVICHSDGSTSQLAGSDAPVLPEPTGNQGDCPMCMGLMSIALLSGFDAPSVDLHLVSARVAVLAEVIAHRLAAVRPPPRGPPAIV